MDLFKQAFDTLERTVEKTVTDAASAVVESASEFPKPAKEPARAAKQQLHISPAAAASQAKKAESSWEVFDWQDQQLHWQAALQQLQDPSSSPPAATLQHQLQQLYDQLLSLPDPLPALNNAATLAAKSAELEASCRSLQQQVVHLQQDQTEVSQLLQDYQTEKEAHAALQAAHRALQDEVSAAKATSSSAGELEQQVKEQADTISSLQATLSSLRAEFESSQSSLFELMSQQEAAAGSASTAEQLAVEELERLTAELQQLRKEKGLLQRQLHHLQHDGAAAAGAAGSAQDATSSSSSDRVNVAGGAAESAQQQQSRHNHGHVSSLHNHHDAEVAALQAELEAAQEAARDQQHEVALLTAKLAAAESRLQRLLSELERRPAASAVAAMGEQLASLSALLGQQLESEGWAGEAAAAAVSAAGNPGQLEPLLQERCRRLELALQAAKADAVAATSAAAAQQQQAQELQQQLEQAQQLVKQLEADVLAMSGSSSSGARSGTAAAAVAAGVSSAASSIGSSMEQQQDAAMLDAELMRLVSTSSAGEGGVQDPAVVAAAAGGLGRAGSAAAAAAAAAEEGQQLASAALLAVVAAQRDRFKGCMTQLESEQASLTAQLQESQVQAEGLKRDNIMLVEKIRFLERYKQQAQAAGGSGGQSVTVIRVDGAGCIVPTDEGFEQGSAGKGSSSKANRYRCGPLSLDLGGGKSAGGSASSSRVAARAAGGGGRLRTRGAGNRQVGCFGVGGDLEDQDEGLLNPESRYLKEYEARLNPFAEFQASESEARLRGMQLHDKAMLAANRLIAGSRMARAGLAVYALLVHAFIFILMYYAASPHTVLEQVVDERPAAGAAAGGDALAAARLAAAGASVDAAAGVGKGAAGMRLLLDLWWLRQ